MPGRGSASGVLFRSAAAWSCGLRSQETEHLISLEWGLGLKLWLQHRPQGLESRPLAAGVPGLGFASGGGAGAGQREAGHLTLGAEAGLACLLYFTRKGTTLSC